ncbi:thioesterase [Sphaerisporangium album]|uniref:Thioesterase n=1 Tax=Sphaerisporangium album TaxID=509200 RepID=A0A367FAJ2_9ACTN|nr:thioesterase [Sphaerisporangium album]
MESAAIDRRLPFGRRSGALRLYCLPHAGGAASTYRSWVDRLPGVAVCPVQPAGREGRLREVPHRRMAESAAELAEMILATADGPYAVYGHSLGALVGFEALREIRRLGGPAATHLVVSGCAAPQVPFDDGPRVGGATDAQIVGMLRRLGGTPEWLLADPDMLAMILPPFRADFEIKESYRYTELPPLDVPITAVCATADPRADGASMRGWRAQTNGPFTAHTLPGGHFAVLEQWERTRQILCEALSLPV